MSDGNITRFEPDSAHLPTMSAAELARLDAMTDEEIEAAARSDPDAQPLTEDELQHCKRVPNLAVLCPTVPPGLSSGVIAHNPDAVKEELAQQP